MNKTNSDILKRASNKSKQWKAKDRKTEIQNVKKTLLEHVWIENSINKTFNLKNLVNIYKYSYICHLYLWNTLLFINEIKVN
jgi:hypothetical protein